MALSSTKRSPVAVIGTGPAGLMAATVLAEAGFPVFVFEKRKGPGRKLLIAGRSGLNVTYHQDLSFFHQNYTAPQPAAKRFLKAFPSERWLEFIHSLGLETFKGTSHRYFIKVMKASPLLRRWMDSLKKKGVEFFKDHEVTDFEVLPSHQIRLHFSHQDSVEVAGVCFALGGASYAGREKPLRWPDLFIRKDLSFTPFQASNVGFKVKWPKGLLQEAEGQALKNVVLKTAKGEKKGDLVITHYGLEGTPVYTLGVSGKAYLDLKPDLSVEGILKKLAAPKENLSLMRRVQKYLNLNPAAQALVFHLTPEPAKKDQQAMAELIKNFPITLGDCRPMEEAISTAGGLQWSELDKDLMLKKYPGVFVAGEMVDWDAPTGGFLIQMCVSQGFVAAHGLLATLQKKPAKKVPKTR